MTRRRGDLTCCDCGTGMWVGPGSSPQGVARCRPCRRAANPQPTRSRFTPVLRPCRTCGEMFETRQSTQVYCRSTCRPHRQGQRSPQASAAARGYGQAHKRERDRWALVVAGGDASCCLCDDPIEPGQPWHLDHTVDRTGYRGVAHSSCNLREGGIRGNRSARRRQPAPT